MIFGSVCSGIEAASCAWLPLGWRCAFTSEIERFPSAVLKHHYPEVQNFGDMLKHKTWNHEQIDLLVGGTPCQSFSVAGLRKGLADPRGNLTLAFLGVVDRTRPSWVVWENVPGILSDKTGAFGAFLGGLGQLGYGFAYRILDAQYFGVAQRRRRVFVIGHSGGLWQRAAAVLFERESLRGDPPPSREAGKATALPIGTRVDRGGSNTEAQGNNLLVARSLRGQAQSSHREDTETMICATLTKNYATHHGRTAGNNGGVAEGQLIGCLNGASGHAVPGNSIQDTDKLISLCLNGGGMGRIDTETETMLAVRQGGFFNAVRRLTPIECEKLQGFSPGYTNIFGTWPLTPDGPRYKALGNSFAVPVVKWIGKRIQLVEDLVPL